MEPDQVASKGMRMNIRLTLYRSKRTALRCGQFISNFSYHYFKCRNFKRRNGLVESMELARLTLP